MGWVLTVGIGVSLASILATLSLVILYLNMLRQVRTSLTWGLFAFSVAALVAAMLGLAFFLRRGDAMEPELLGPLVAQAVLLAFALVVLALATWLPNGFPSRGAG